MRLTRGALGMLLKKYRQVLRRCGILNFAGALAIAGMCAVPAYAAEPLPPVVIVSGEKTISEPMTVNNLIVGEDVALTVAIPSPDTDNPQYLRVDGTLLLSGGSINAEGPMGIQGGKYDEDLLTQGGNVYSGALEMTGGTMNINSSIVRMGAATITGGIVNVSGERVPDETGWMGNFSRLPSVNEDDIFMVSGSGTRINLGDYAGMTGAEMDISDATITMSGDTIDSTAFLRAWSDRQINISNANIHVADGKYGMIMAPTLNINNSNINVDGTLTLMGFVNSQVSGPVSNILRRAATGDGIISGGAINLAEGANLNVNWRYGLTLKDGASFNNAGNVTVEGSGKLDLREADFTARPGSRLVSVWETNNQYYSSGYIRLTDQQLPEALKGGIELRGGSLFITGAVNIPGQGYFSEEASDGKIAMTDFGANFSADNLTVTGSEISLPVGGTLTAHNLNLDQNVTSNTTLHIRSVGEDASVDVGDGNGTLNTPGLEISGNRSVKTGNVPSNIDVNGNIVTRNLFITASENDAGLYSTTNVNLNKSVSINEGFAQFQGANVTLASGGATRPNVLELKQTQLNNYAAGGLENALYLNQDNTQFKADASSTIFNNANIYATTASLGLTQSNGAWSSSNLQTKIIGGGQLNLTGTGAAISKESFKNLRDTLTTNILSVDATITGAVVDGMTDLADVEIGGILAGANLGSAIVTGSGNAGNGNYLTGRFGGVNLTNSQATGITVTRNEKEPYNHVWIWGREAAANNNGNLVNTANGAGDVIVNHGASVSLTGGNVKNVDVNSGSASFTDANLADLHLESSQSVSADSTARIYGNVTMDKVTVTGVDLSGEDKYEAAGELHVYEGAKLTVNGDIGDNTHVVGALFSAGDVMADSIHVYNIRANAGTINVKGDLDVKGTSNLNGALINPGGDVDMDAINVANGSAINSGGSVAASTITANDGSVTAANDVTATGAVNLTDGSIAATSGSAVIGGAAVLAGSSSISAGRDITLASGLNVTSGSGALTAANGDINAEAQDIGVSGGAELRMAASNGVINARNITANNIDASQLNASGDLTVNSGELKLSRASEVKGVANLLAAKTTVGDISVGGQLLVDGGQMNSSGTITLADNAALSNGAQVKLDTLLMAADKTLTVGNSDEATGGTTLTVDSLSLNGADLLVDPAWGKASSNVAVRGFSSNGSARDIVVDGNVVVGRNSYLTLGSNDNNWLPGVVTGPMVLPGLRQDGVTAALGIFSPITLGRGHSLTVDGSWRSGQSYNRNNSLINFASQSLLVVNGKGGNISYTGSNKPEGVQAAISAEAQTSATVASGARLFVTGVEQDTSYVILDPQTIDVNFEDNTTAWAGDNIGSDNPLLVLRRSDLSGGDRGEVTTRPMSASVALPGLDSELGSAMDNAQANGQIGVNEANMRNGARGQQFLSRALAQASPVYGNDPAGAARNVESAARMAVLGGVPQMALSANNAAGAAVTQRTSLANPAANGIQSMNSEGAIQDNGMASRGLALWLMPLYQSSNGFGMEAGNFDYDFSGALGGVAIGADYTFENMLRAGLLFNIGGGYMRGGGDLNATTNSMNFWGLGAYVGWNNNNFGLTADVNFTSTYNKVRQDIYGMGDFSELKLDVPAWALSAGLRAEYKVNTDYLDITPHVGFRYTNLNVESYDIKDHGTVIDGDSMSQNIWTFPIGVSFSRDVALANGWSFKPMLDLNVTPAAGDIKAKSKLRFTGTGTEAELDTKMMDYVTYGGTAGIELKKDNFSVGVNYTGMFGAESSAHGVFGTFRYEF